MVIDPNTSGNLSLEPIGENPYVGETPQVALNSWLTPNQSFYVRSQFDYPDVNERSWKLQVTDSTRKEITFILLPLGWGEAMK